MFLTQLFLIQLCLTKILSFEKRFFHLFNLSSFFPFSFCKHVLQLKGLVTSSRHFCFPKFSPWKATGCKEKNQVTFFMVSFKTNLFSKISYMHWLFWAVHQIKKAYGTSFYCRFSAYLFHKNVSYQMPY